MNVGSGLGIEEARSAAPSHRKPPPAGRSPLKTNIGATPRRPSSVGAPSSRPSLTPGPASTVGPANRKLDYSQNSPKSTLKSVHRSPRDKSPRLNGSASKDRDEYSISPSRSPPPRPDDIPLVNGINCDDGGENDFVNGTMEDDDPLPAIENGVDGSIEGAEDAEDGEGSQPQDDAAEAVADNGKVKERARRGRKKRGESVNDAQAEDFQTEAPPEPENVQEPAAPARGRRGRAAKKQAMEQEADKNAAPKKGRKPALGKKDANKKVKAASRGEKTFKKPAIPHRLQRERHQTPFEEDTLSHTRSGRLTYKPLNWWKGERAVFEENKMDRTITEVVRMEDVTPRKRVRPARSGSAKPRRRKRKRTVFEEEQDEDAQDEDAEDFVEPWEMEEGVVSGSVRMWDPEVGAGIDERREQGELTSTRPGGHLFSRISQARQARFG